MADHLLETLECDAHGPFVENRDWGHGCPKCREEYAEERNREEAVREARWRLESADIPPRFRGKTLEFFRVETPAQKKVLGIARDFVARFDEHCRVGRCLIFCGNIGTGKTLLSCAIIQALISTEFLSGNGSRSGFIYRAEYVTADDVIRRIRDTWRTGAGTSETSVIESFVKAHLLVIDEAGAQTGTDSERAHVYAVIDKRYQAVRPTIVVSNCGREGLTNALGERAMDRLRDNGGLMCVFNWPSWRDRESKTP
jgi:DNA replication protein DnaC